MKTEIESLNSFESDVISDGTQTIQGKPTQANPFESDVISDGTQTIMQGQDAPIRFESDVISDGTQTTVNVEHIIKSLRVM